MNNNPLVSVIILNYNGIKDTIECLDSLKPTTYDNYEVIVVDNASADNSLEILRKRDDIKLIEADKNYGFAEGNNIGLKASSGKIACLLNNDTTVDPEWLNELMNTLLSDEKITATYAFFIDYGTPKEKMWPTPGILKTLKNGTYNLIGYLIDNVFDDYVTTYLAGSACCLLFWKNIFDKCCDEDYFIYYDDVYFCWRLKLQGYEIKRSPYSVIYHKYSATTQTKWRKGKAPYLCERNRIMTLLIFYELKTLFKILPLLLLDEIKKVMLMIIRLFYNPGYVLVILSARFWLLRNIANIYKKRKRIQSERRVPDEDIIGGLSCRITNGSSPLANALNRLSFYYAKFLNLKTYEVSKCKNER